MREVGAILIWRGLYRAELIRHLLRRLRKCHLSQRGRQTVAALSSKDLPLWGRWISSKSLAILTKDG